MAGPDTPHRPGHRHRPGPLAGRGPGRGRADHPRRTGQPAPAVPRRASRPRRRLRCPGPDRLPAGGPRRRRPAARLAVRGPSRQGPAAGEIGPVHRHQHPGGRDRRRGRPVGRHQDPAARAAQPCRRPAPAQRRAGPDRLRRPAGHRGVARSGRGRLPQPGGGGCPRGPDRRPDRRAGDRRRCWPAPFPPPAATGPCAPCRAGKPPRPGSWSSTPCGRPAPSRSVVAVPEVEAPFDRILAAGADGIAVPLRALTSRQWEQLAGAVEAGKRLWAGALDVADPAAALPRVARRRGDRLAAVAPAGPAGVDPGRAAGHARRRGWPAIRRVRDGGAGPADPGGRRAQPARARLAGTGAAPAAQTACPSQRSGLAWSGR